MIIICKFLLHLQKTNNMNTKLLTALMIPALLFTFLINVSAQNPDKIVGIWLTQDGDSKVEISKNTKGHFEGKIIWLKTPLNEAGKPKVDHKNPEVKLQSRPILGLKLLENFVFVQDDQEWTDGTIYDPKSGSTYKCNMWFDGNDKTLYVKGYIGFSLIGKKVTWTRVN